MFAGLLAAVPASAHSNLLFTAPAADSTVATAPDTLTLLFDEPVTTAGTPVSVAGPQGRGLTVGTPRLSHENRALEIPIPESGGQGIYTVHWQVTAGDGDVMSGSYRYAVGPAATALSGGQATETQGSWQTTVLRVLLFAALAVALGEQAGTRLLARRRGTPAGPRPITLWACLLGVAAAAGLAILLLGNGSLLAGFTHPVPEALTGSRPGILTLVEVSGFALAATAAAVRSRWLWLPLAVVIVAEALRAHPQLADPLLGAPLTVLHLTAATLWTGILVHVLRTLIRWRQRRDMARQALGAYSRAAVWLFAAVVLTGLGSALILVPPDSLITTDYGRVLLAKTGLVAAAAGLALTARRLLRRKSVLDKVIRPVRVEAATLLAVLVVSSVLTVLPVPASADAPLAFPPPATGPVVPAAALAGEVGVNARASSGQLIIQLLAPEITDASGRTASARLGLTGSLSGPDGEITELRFRGCGEGCFFSPAAWQEGTSRLTLTPASGTWNTEPAALSISWPARPAEQMLRDAVAAMKQVPAFTLHELVTSDTARGLGTPQSFRTTGTDFIRRALYASGEASIAVRLPDEDGNRRLVLSYPAENAVLELTLASDGRILHETQTAPHHLVTRTLIYPEPESHHD